MILRKGERSGNIYSAFEMDEFKAAMNKLEVIDLPLSGGQWTWSNQRSSSRIDEFLVSAGFLTQLFRILQKTLPRPTSDHFPICLIVDGVQWGPVPFRFDNKWLENDRFSSMVEEKWKSYEFRRSDSFSIASKLRELKKDIKGWFKIERKKEVVKSDSILAEINDLNLKEESCGLNDKKCDKRVALKLQMASSLKDEKIAWRQKSRERWIAEDDHNTKYFDTLTTHRIQLH